MLKEVNSRTNGGVTVTLLVEFENDKPLYGVVQVVSDSETFTLDELLLEQCADVYFHPFAYADRLLTTGRLERVAA